MCSIMGYLGKTLTKEDLKPFFDRTVSRGPDMQRFVSCEGSILGFERLSIMVPSCSMADCFDMLYY